MEVYKVIEDFLLKLDNSLHVVSFVSGTDTTDIVVSYLKWCKPTGKAKVNGEDVSIISIVGNTIKVDKKYTSITSFSVAIPYFFHGTVSAVENQLQKIPATFDKTPFIWLHEVIDENYDDNPLSDIEKTPDLRLFFIDYANLKEWTTDDHYSKVINRMTIVADMFIEKAKTYKYFNKFDSHKRRNHVKFGRYEDQTGHTSQIFSDNLSGIEMQISLPLNKINNCLI